MTSHQSHCVILGWVWSLLPVLSAVWAHPAHSQIIPDGTLPSPSQVLPLNCSVCLITGGTPRGNLLFHSFQEFSVPTGGAAGFNSAPVIRTILVRVTGDRSSTIDGSLITNNTNLFLLNPNGIIFGPNAQLRVGGSFLASTADRIQFADGNAFSAVNPTPPLLTMTIPVGLQFGTNPRAIVQQSRNITVPAGRTLALIGGAIAIDGGVLSAPNGHIELASLGSFNSVGLTVGQSGLQFNYANTRSFQDIQVTNRASVGLNLPSAGGNTIAMTARNLRLQEESQIVSTATTTNPGGAITLTLTDTLALSGGTAPSSIATLTSTANPAGNIQISAQQLNLTDGSQILSLTRGDGHTGNVDINVAGSVTAIGTSPNGGFSSGILNQAAALSQGNVGSLTINTNTLNVQAGAQIQAVTFGAGSAGALTVNATTVDLSGAVLNPDRTVVTRNGIPIVSGIFASADANSTGNAGTLIVNTQQLQLRDGAVIQTSTLGAGDAGDLFINANAIALSGTTPDVRSPTAILAASGGIPRLFVGNPSAIGKGGTITINTTDLLVEQGAEIAVSSLNPSGNSRGSGNLQIQAENITLRDRGRLNAETASGNGGNINLNIGNLLVLRRHSTISATAGTSQTGGDGGNITIRAPFIVAAFQENSDIFANAFTGRGGNITITTNAIYGLRFQPQLTPLSDITASSQFGLNGTVTINVLNLDPSRGLVTLPGNFTDPSQQISQACQTSRNADSSFVATGRGGIPLSPAEPLESRPVATRWVGEDEPDRVGKWESQGIEAPHTSIPTSPPPLMEANHILQNRDRTIELVAQGGDRRFGELGSIPCQLTPTP